MLLKAWLGCSSLLEGFTELRIPERRYPGSWGHSGSEGTRAHLPSWSLLSSFNPDDFNLYLDLQLFWKTSYQAINYTQYLCIKAFGFSKSKQDFSSIFP